MERIQHHRKVPFILTEKKAAWHISISFHIKINVSIVGISKTCCSEGLWEKAKKFLFSLGWHHEARWPHALHHRSERSGFEPWPETLLCSSAKHLTPTAPLSTLEPDLRWTSLPSRGSRGSYEPVGLRLHFLFFPFLPWYSAPAVLLMLCSNEGYFLHT